MNSSSGSSLSSSCFYPNTSGEEAETILKSVGRHGSFLLRLCNQVNGHHRYTLSVMSNECITHFKMQCSNGYYSIRGEGEFESPYDVIQNCVENPDILKEKDSNVIELKEPVVNSKKPTRWCHDNINHKDAERILNENGKHGSFLVRASYRQPGDYALCVRLKDEILCVKIYANGEKFDIGGGKQFKSISDLILHYKKYPLKTIKGIDIYLDQGIDTDSITKRSSVKYGGYIPSISWDPPTVVTLSTVCTNDHECQGKAIGMLQVCKENGNMTISLNGRDDCYSKFKMYKSLIQDDPNSDDIYCIICLESYAYPGNYLHWTTSNKESVEIYSCTNGGKMPPSSIREICWFRHSLQPDTCDCTQSIEAKATRGVSDLSISDNNEVCELPLTNSDETHKIVAWSSPPYQYNFNKLHTQYYFLTFNATKHEPEDYAAKLTPEFSLSSNVVFSGDADTNCAQLND